MKIKVKIAERHEEIIKISTPFIKLDSLLKFAGAAETGISARTGAGGRLLKFAGAAETGAMAKQFILDGRVKVNKEICTARGKKIKDGDTVSFLNTDYKIINED